MYVNIQQKAFNLSPSTSPGGCITTFKATPSDIMPVIFYLTLWNVYHWIISTLMHCSNYWYSGNCFPPKGSNFPVKPSLLMPSQLQTVRQIWMTMYGNSDSATTPAETICKLRAASKILALYVELIRPSEHQCPHASTSLFHDWLFIIYPLVLF